jgi:hypothetical protein
MMSSIRPVFILFTVLTLYGFSLIREKITNCYINFNKFSEVKAASVQRLSTGEETTRQFQTPKGNVAVSSLDGYRILYKNKKEFPLITLHVNLSDSKTFANDTTNILESLKYRISHEAQRESKELIRLNYNGYTIFGIERNAVNSEGTLGSFVMFPAHNLVVYFEFNNTEQKFKNLRSLRDYKIFRNGFLGAYTDHLNKCLNK